MYHTTGLTRGQLTDLVATVHQFLEKEDKKSGRPPVIGLFKSVVAVLWYLRRNRVQAEIAELLGVSQSTVSRRITTLTPVLEEVLADYIPTLEELPDKDTLIVDGSLLTCWSWADAPELYSGKHRTTGLNVQVVTDLAGRRVYVSEPVSGKTHDAKGLRQSGILDHIQPGNLLGDKGYVGLEMLTPIKKPPHRNLLDWEKEFNKQINKIRYVVERAIANFKTWRILFTDYRRPRKTFPQIIKVVTALDEIRTYE